ncbi:MAG TPA: hypothetical protein VEY30_03580, partial [Myxococcaceae bacterium]|nr:hypothetical protein [Myxococcaceae bacterium]
MIRSAVLLGLAVSASALAAPQLMVAAQGGIFVPSATALRPGPLAGFSLGISPWRQFALVAAVQRSTHDFNAVNRSFRARQDAASFGLEYRVDVGPVVPYAAALGQYSRLQILNDLRTDWSGALGLGFYV